MPFEERVTQANPLVGEDYQKYISTNISVEPLSGDYTLAATLRALLEKRVEAGTSFSQTFVRAERNGDSFSISLPTGDHRLVLIIIPGTKETSKEFIDGLEVVRGYTEVMDIGAYIQKGGPSCRVFQNKTKKRTHVYINSMSPKPFQIIAALARRILPWYFEEENNYSLEEEAFCRSIADGDIQKFESFCQAIYDMYDIYAMRLKSELGGFESEVDKRICRNLEKKVGEHQVSLDAAISTVNRCYGQLVESSNLLVAMKDKVEKGISDGDIMRYFVNNKSLEFISRSGMSIRYIAKTFIEYFDEHDFEIRFNNPNSLFYTRDSSDFFSDKENKRKLLKALFVDEVAKIRTFAQFVFSLDGTINVDNNMPAGFDQRGYMPQPHLVRYSCMGNSEEAILSALRAGQYTTAIEQSLASAKNINFNDETVVSTFLGSLYIEKYGKCIQMADGRIVGAQELVEILDGGIE